MRIRWKEGAIAVNLCLGRFGSREWRFLAASSLPLGEEIRGFISSHLGGHGNAIKDEVTDGGHPVPDQLFERSHPFECKRLSVKSFKSEELDGAQNIKKSILECFERTSLPNLSEEEQENNLDFIVIGDGPTGVEFAAKLHEIVNEDLAKLYPVARKCLNISVIEAGGFLTMLDPVNTEFTEEKTKFKVSDKDITMTNRATEIGGHPIVFNSTKREMKLRNCKKVELMNSMWRLTCISIVVSSRKAVRT